MIRAATPEDFAWFGTRCSVGMTPGATGIVAEVKGVRYGMVAFDRWTPNACEMHVVLDPRGWGAYRSLLEAAFAYVFTQLGRAVVTAQIAVENTASLRLAERLGFKLAHRVLDGWKPGVDLVLMTMRRDECRWLKRPLLEVA